MKPVSRPVQHDLTPDMSAPEDPSLCDVSEVVRRLASDGERGLTAALAAERLRRDGANALRVMPPRAAWRRMLAQLADPLVYLLLAAAGVALVAWFVEGRQGWPTDAIVVALVVVLNALLGYLQEAKAANAVAALARMTAVSSTVVRDGVPSRIAAAGLVCGDLLLLAEGDAVGADARLLRCASLRVQESSLTGESEAVQKDVATLAQAATPGDRLCMVFKGTAVVQGTGTAIVTATGMASEMGRIASLLDATEEAPTPLQREIAYIGRALGMAAVLISALVVAVILLISDLRSLADVIHVLLLGVSLAVAAVPEGLPAIISVVLALGVLRMARRHAIVKNLASVETLGSTSVIAADKTGTLTRAQMTIVRVLTPSGATTVSGVGYTPQGEFLAGEVPLPATGNLRDEQAAVIGGGCLAGNARLQQAEDLHWAIQGDPTEAAFLVAERKLAGVAAGGVKDVAEDTADGTVTGRDSPEALRQQRFSRIGELPFTSDRKMMSTLNADHAQGDARVLVCKGAPDVLLLRCTRLRLGTTMVALDETWRQRLLADLATLSEAALRTLAVAYRTLAEDEALNEAAEQRLVFLGMVGIIDPPRHEVAAAVREAHGAGIRVIMITGDHPRTALRIATDLGIVAAGSPVLTGVAMDALDAQALAVAVRHTSVFARVAPRNKLRIVAALQAAGEVVAMTGDGVNDAPALKAADIGIAMGVTGTEVTREAARMILADDNFATIVDAVREGRGVLDNIRKFLRYLLSSNLGEVLTVFLGVVGAGVIGLASPDAVTGGVVVLPLLAAQILWINLVTDAGPALAMGVDPIAGDVMARRPRRRDERVIDARMWFGVVEIGVVMALTSLLTLDIFLPGGLVEGTGDLVLARTACFTVLVFAQLFNCFNARSEDVSAFAQPFSNRWLWATVAASVLLQMAVVHLPVLNVAFGTTPLSLGQWGVCVAMASVVLGFSELRKAVNRWRHAR
ncbi:cation-translocating P-type ATPase [Rhodocyclus gracilis]|nr:cation-translocating P-type ATPase [Rhodocyclus gracilis]